MGGMAGWGAEGGDRDEGGAEGAEAEAREEGGSHGVMSPGPR